MKRLGRSLALPFDLEVEAGNSPARAKRGLSISTEDL
jgi:hypothetical protein